MINHPSIHATKIIIVLKLMVSNQIHDSKSGYKDHFIANCLKLENSDNKVNCNIESYKTREYRWTKIEKTSDNST